MILDHSHLTEQELIDALSQLQHLRHELKILDGRVADLERAVNYPTYQTWVTNCR